MSKKKHRLGLVGACGRGASFKLACDAQRGRVAVHAVCDTNEAELESARQRLGAERAFVDYDEMIASGDVDAVIIGTPMNFHVPQSLTAIRAGVSVLSEVPAAISIEECRELVTACEHSDAVYMMAENYTYARHSVLVRELVRRGLFGDVYYAEGEYLHELKGLNEITTWRRKWQTGIDGITYGTHSLGPILQWFAGDRVARVCCAGSGHHYRDVRGHRYEAQDCCVMLGQMRAGGLVKIRVDMLSDRPHSMTCLQLQGTDGCFESRRGMTDDDKIWLRCRQQGETMSWEPLSALGDEFLPDWYRQGMAEAAKAGHGGGDYFEILDFIDAVDGVRPTGIGIHEAMDMTLPGLVSQQSVLQGGAWLPVPDSRDWAAAAGRQPQLQMCWPSGLAAPAPETPAGYCLRQFTSADLPGYIELAALSGFGRWTPERVIHQQRATLPGGFWIIEEASTGAIVAAAVANHGSRPEVTPAGEVGWVMAHPDHRGCGLGRAVTLAALQRLCHAGYSYIYLLTDDFRLAALKLYLRLGFEPVIHDQTIAARWAKARAAVGC